MSLRTAFGLSIVSLACLHPLDGGQYKGLWLKVSDEVAPAGSAVQVRVTLTEPKPIIRTRLDMEFDASVVSEITSVSVFSVNGEASGTAVRFGNLIRIEVSSPTGNLGSAEELPLVALAVRLRADARPGASTLFRIRPESEFWEEDDELWEIEDNAPGVVKIGGNLAIEDLWPSGGMIQPGQTVRILGRGFRPDSVIEIEGAPFAMTAVVSSTEINLSSSVPFLLDQRRVTVRNPDDSEATFLTALRGRDTSPSAYDLLAATAPMFPPFASSSTVIRLSEESGGPGRFAGLALQNPGANPVSVYVQALSPNGGVLGATTLGLAKFQRVVRHLDELIPYLHDFSGITLRVEADSPIQILGLEGNLNTGSIQPISPPSLQ
jgi:hypothetical protein